MALRPRTPTAQGGLSLGGALTTFAGRMRQGGQRSEKDRERSRVMFFQASDAWSSDFNDALASGELDRMEPAELDAWGDEKIEELSESLAREFPDEAERWRSNTRAKLAPLIAGRRDEEKREAQARLLGQVTEADERIRRELPEQLRLIADPATPDAVRVAAFGVLDVLTKEHEMLVGQAPEGEGRERMRAEFAEWLNEEKLDAAVFHYASQGRMEELAGRIRNRTDYWDPEDKEARARITSGIGTDAVQEALDDGWIQQERILAARAGRRQAALNANEDMRRERYETVRDAVLSGELARGDGIAELRRHGYEGGAHSVSSLLEAVKSRSLVEDELSGIDMERDGQMRAVHDAAMLGVRTLTRLEARNSLAAARRQRDAGLLTGERFTSYKQAIEEEMAYRAEVDAEASEAEKERNEQIRLASRAAMSELGAITFFDTGFAAQHLKPAKIALTQRADYHLRRWIHANEATGEQIAVAYESWLPAVVESFTAMKLPKDLWTGEVPIVAGAGGEDEEQPSGVVPGTWSNIWEGLFGGDDEDAPDAARRGPSVTEQIEADAVQHLPIADLTQALDAMARTGQPVDTHRELFSLLPLGQAKAYVRYHENGAMDARATLNAIDDAPNVSPEMAHRIWVRVIEPVAASAERVRGWRSGAQRAKDAAEWMKAKGL